MSQPVFKNKQDVLARLGDICPDLPMYRDMKMNNNDRAFKIREEYREFMRAKEDTPHEAEELFDIIHSAVSYLRTVCYEDVVKEGYTNYVSKHRDRHNLWLVDNPQVEGTDDGN